MIRGWIGPFVLQTGAVLMSRRTLLLAALASSAAACSSTRAAAPVESVALPPLVGSPGAAVTGALSTIPNPPKSKVPNSVTMVGDSITALSKDALTSVLDNVGFATVTIDAEPNRRIEVGSKKPKPGLAVVKFIAVKDPPDLWVIGLGTNDAGQFATDDEYKTLIDDVLAQIPPQAPLVWMTVYRSDHLPGCVQFNNVLRATLKSRGNATIADWYGQVVAYKGKILSGDGVHPNASGILVFADTIRTAIAQRLA